MSGRLFGPKCGEIVQARTALKARFGGGPATQTTCEHTGARVFVTAEALKTCGTKSCAACTYNTKPWISMRCPLEEKLDR